MPEIVERRGSSPGRERSLTCRIIMIKHGHCEGMEYGYLDLLVTLVEKYAQYLPK